MDRGHKTDQQADTPEQEPDVPRPERHPGKAIWHLRPDGTAFPEPQQLSNLLADVPEELANALRNEDGLSKACCYLEAHSGWCDSGYDVPEALQKIYGLVTYYYRALQQPLQVLALYESCYRHMLSLQQTQGRKHKGLPLVRMSEAFFAMGWQSLAERYLMLTAVEDAISDSGNVRRDGGVFWRMVRLHGARASILDSLYQEVFRRKDCYDKWDWCPESVLQDIQSDWRHSVPFGQETRCWQVNQAYCSAMLGRLGREDGDGGKVLERLAEYLIGCVPGIRTTRRSRTHSTELDIFCTVEGESFDFRQDLGRQWICECKDTDSVGFADIAKFARVLESSRCTTGVLFSRKPVSGAGQQRDAFWEIVKLFQHRGIVILNVHRRDLENVVAGESLISVLRRKYEEIRLDLWRKEAHPAGRADE